MIGFAESLPKTTVFERLVRVARFNPERQQGASGVM